MGVKRDCNNFYSGATKTKGPPNSSIDIGRGICGEFMTEKKTKIHRSFLHLYIYKTQTRKCHAILYTIQPSRLLESPSFSLATYDCDATIELTEIENEA